VPFIEPGVGAAIATLAFVNPFYGYRGSNSSDGA
jgi:uncharacterized Ntn-hydrolase superfamily protein